MEAAIAEPEGPTAYRAVAMATFYRVESLMAAASPAPSVPHLAKRNVGAISQTYSTPELGQLLTIIGVIPPAARLRIAMDTVEYPRSTHIDALPFATQIQQMNHIRSRIHRIEERAFDQQPAPIYDTRSGGE